MTKAYVEAMKYLTKGPMCFQSRPMAHRFYKQMNDGLKLAGRKSRIKYRLFGKGKKTCAMAHVVTPKKKK